ncbi:hypothetical protein SAMN02745220_00613 [Desulfopila aestuarii DSM 18488]|uniref:Uncharacterized protein n=1 Tax=Desulfopila aestuarii DSM 18488 TaxID=1121416 RepID=A0A1M7XYC1_9BACT|nr:hypothetical protein SAMN02745220_00613 [Desulfopila aestuarii DSM 18488]
MNLILEGERHGKNKKIQQANCGNGKCWNSTKEDENAVFLCSHGHVSTVNYLENSTCSIMNE